jgi:hypothetical protein
MPAGLMGAGSAPVFVLPSAGRMSLGIFQFVRIGICTALRRAQTYKGGVEKHRFWS